MSPALAASIAPWTVKLEAVHDASQAVFGTHTTAAPAGCALKNGIVNARLAQKTIAAALRLPCSM